MPRLKSVTDANGTKIYPITITRGVYDTDKNQRLNETLANKAENTVMGASGSNHAKGLVPDPGATAGTSKYLREDGTWQTPTDTKVTLTAVTTNADYEVLFSATADNTTRTEAAKKASNLKFNPSTGNLQATKLNGVAIGSNPKFDATKVEASETNGNIKIDGVETTVYTLPATDPYTSARTPSSHTHGNITNTGTITSTAVTSATGVLVYDSNNKIQRATAAQTRSIIGAGTSSFSGSYTDLTNKPTIPAAANNGTFSVKTKVGSDSAVTAADFTANQSSADDVTFIQGSNVTLTTDTTNRTITIAATDNNTTYKLNVNGTDQGGGATSLGTVYAPNTSGNSGQVLLSSGGAPNWKTGDIVHYVTSPSGTAGTKDSNRTQWTGTIDGVVALYTGLVVMIKVPLAGVNKGVTLNVNSLGEHPVVLNTNTIVTTHYPVGAIMPLVYDADQKATVMVSGTNQEYTGCWKIANYDSNTTYSAGTAALLTTGTNTSNRVWQAKILADYVTSTAAAANTNTAQLQISDTENKKINTAESTDKYIQFTGGTNKFTVSNGTSSFDVSVTPSITNNVTGSSLTADKIVLGNGSSAVKSSSKGITTTAPSSTSDDTTIPTSKAVWSAVSNGIAANDAMVYKGTIAGGSTGSYGALTAAASKGWTYKVTTAGKIDGVAVEVGDMLICNTDSTGAATSSNYSTIAANWDFILANIDGAVTGPASSTDDNLASFNGADGKVVKDSGLTTTDVSDAVTKKHSHSSLTLSTTAQAYDGTHTLALPSSDPYSSARTPASHTHGNIANGGTLTDTAAAAAGNDYVVIRDADNAKIQTSTIKGTDVADAVTKKHEHSTLTLSTTALAYDGTHTLALPASDPYSSARTPSSHTHGNIQNGGTLLTTDITIASGDKLVVTDSSNSNKVARTSVSFDGSTTTKALTLKGTFESFATSNTTYKFTIGTTTKGDSTNGVDLGTLKSETAVASGDTLSLVTTGEKATWNAKQNALTFTSTPSSTNKVVTLNDVPSTLPANGGNADTVGGFTVGVNVPANAVFTDNNNAVTQTATTTSAAYEVLFSATADNTTRTEGARKTSTLTYNPSTKALLTGGTIDGLTLAKQTTGFKISGGTTSKTLTVGADYTLGAACAKGVTDNSSATAVTSSDTNLITARTLYYAGYTKNVGTVTQVKVGTTAYNPSSGVVSLPAYPTTLPASDVSAWAKESDKPSYNYSEIGYTVNTTTANGVYTGAITIDGTKPIHVIAITGNVTVTLSNNPPAGHSTHVLFTSTAARTVTIAHDNTARVCPLAANVVLSIPANGYAEVDFLNANSKIYVRGV